MKLYKRKGSPNWWLSLGSGKNRKRVSLETTNKAIANKRAEDLQQKEWMIKNGLLEVKKEVFVFDRLVSDYVDNVIDSSNKAERSKGREKTQINRFLEFIGLNVPLTDISESHCNQYVGIMSESLAEVTVHKNVSILRRLFNYAMKPPYNMTYNPWEWSQKAKELSSKTEKKKPCPWDLILKAISSTKNDKDRMFWTLLAYTGMAPIDASVVTKKDFLAGQFFRSKSKVPFALCYHSEIQKYGDAIFGLYQKRSQRDDSNRRFKAITGHILYDIRRQFASTLLNKFKSAEDAAAFTGHTNVKTLVEHYATADPKIVQQTLTQIAPNSIG